MVFLGRLDILGDAAAEQVALALGGELGEGVVARRLLAGRRRGLERLGVRGEVLAAVGGIEAFGEDDQGGSGFGGFEDTGAGAGEVGGLVGALWEGRVREKGGCGEGEAGVDVPVASCTRASLRGFFRRCAIFIRPDISLHVELMCSSGDVG